MKTIARKFPNFLLIKVGCTLE